MLTPRLSLYLQCRISQCRHSGKNSNFTTLLLSCSHLSKASRSALRTIWSLSYGLQVCLTKPSLTSPPITRPLLTSQPNWSSSSSWAEQVSVTPRNPPSFAFPLSATLSPIYLNDLPLQSYKVLCSIFKSPLRKTFLVIPYKTADPPQPIIIPFTCLIFLPHNINLLLPLSKLEYGFPVNRTFVFLIAVSAGPGMYLLLSRCSTNTC